MSPGPIQEQGLFIHKGQEWESKKKTCPPEKRGDQRDLKEEMV